MIQHILSLGTLSAFLLTVCQSQEIQPNVDSLIDPQQIGEYILATESNFTIAHNGDYIASVQLGTLNLNVLFASAEDTPWFPDVNCASCQNTLGDNQNLVDFTQQPTYKMVDDAVQNITYASGSIQGYQSTDNLILTSNLQSQANLTAFEFLAVISVEQLSLNTLKQGQADGVIGLAPRTDKESNILEQLYSQKLVSNKQILLHNTGITFGYLSEQPTTWTSLSSSYFWQVPLQGVYLNNQEIQIQGAQAVIDTTQQGIVVPQEDLQLVLNWFKKDKLCQLAKNKASDISSGQAMQCLCDDNTEFPNIYIQINGQKLALKPEDYIEKQGSWCLALIEGQNVYGSGWWILGQKFLQNTPVVLDQHKKRLGFITKNDEVETVQVSMPFMQIMTYVVATVTALTILFVIVQLATKLDCLATETDPSVTQTSIAEIRRPNVAQAPEADDQFNRQ